MPSSLSSNRHSLTTIVNLLAGFVVLWALVILYLHSSMDDIAINNSSLIHQGREMYLHNNNDVGEKNHPQDRDAETTGHNVDHQINNNNNTPVIDDNNNNPWYGWQPLIPKEMACSWRKCFKNMHMCTTCRDSVEDWGQAPPEPKNWIPDVTMLRRMYVNGVDHQGNPWPPPINDPEMCEPIGASGGPHDDNLQLIRGVPIVAQPFEKTTHTTIGNKLLCLMYTMEKSHATSIRAIRETWAPGCDGYLAFTTMSDPRIPAISIAHDGPEEYNNMWQKVRSIWKFVGQHYLEEFDWFYLGGEDMYVLPQNLKVYLQQFDSSQDYFLGRRFKGYGAKDNYFNSGGAGYVLSKSALTKFYTQGLEHPRCNPNRHTPMEDVMIAECLRRVLDIPIFDTRDDAQRERFHPFSPGSHLNWQPPMEGGKDWYYDYNLEWGLKLGLECCAPDSVSFHYIKKPATMRHLHKLLYDCPESEKE